MRKDLTAMFLAGVLSTALLIGAVMLISTRMPSVDAQSSTATWGSTYFYNPQRDLRIEDFDAWLAQVPIECDLVPTTQLNYWVHRCPEGVTIPDPE